MKEMPKCKKCGYYMAKTWTASFATKYVCHNEDCENNEVEVNR